MRTLYERADNIVTEQEDTIEEIQHVNKALSTCGYPKWTFKQVRSELETREERKAMKKKDKNRKDGEEPTKVTVTLLYIRGVSESLQ